MTKKKDIFTKDEKEFYEKLGKDFSHEQLFGLIETFSGCAIVMSNFLDKISHFIEIPEEVEYSKYLTLMNVLAIVCKKPTKTKINITEKELKDKFEMVVEGIKTAYEILKKDGYFK